MARPIPCPAAVTSASLPCRRKAMVGISVPYRTPLNRIQGIWFIQCCLNGLAARMDGMPLRDDGELVIVARHACLRHAVVFHGGLEKHPPRGPVAHAALNFLPWRLAPPGHLFAPLPPPHTPPPRRPP